MLFRSNIGLLKLGLVILACFAAEVGRAQFTFATAQVLTGDLGSVTNDNATAASVALNICGFPAYKPLWYQWTPTVDGEVELDTIGSVGFVFVTNSFVIMGVTNTFVTTNSIRLDTVLGVFTGTSLANLNQVAANDDLFPINSSISLVGHSLAQINESGSGDYAQIVGPEIGRAHV